MFYFPLLLNFRLKCSLRKQQKSLTYQQRESKTLAAQEIVCIIISYIDKLIENVPQLGFYTVLKLYYLFPSFILKYWETCQ